MHVTRLVRLPVGRIGDFTCLREGGPGKEVWRGDNGEVRVVVVG